MGSALNIGKISTRLQSLWATASALCVQHLSADGRAKDVQSDMLPTKVKHPNQLKDITIGLTWSLQTTSSVFAHERSGFDGMCYAESQ